MIKRIHHVGIAVKNLKESITRFEGLLGIKPASIENAPCQQVNEAVFKIGEGAEIDLIEAAGPDSAVGRFIEKRGEGLHHICFEVDDIDTELNAMAAKGIELVDRQGRPGVAGKIGFLNPRSADGVLIELVQVETRPGG